MNAVNTPTAPTHLETLPVPVLKDISATDSTAHVTFLYQLMTKFVLCIALKIKDYYDFVSRLLPRPPGFGGGFTPKFIYYILIYLCAKIGAFVKNAQLISLSALLQSVFFGMKVDSE